MKKRNIFFFIFIFLFCNSAPIKAEELSFFSYFISNFSIDEKNIASINYKMPTFLSINLVKSSTPSIKYYVDRLEARKLPVDLALLPLIESGNNPQARSNKNAVGLWQFMPRTAKEWGLIPERFRDDRKNVIRSTETALNYLNYLYEDLGDWNLALMAYNWGIGSVKKALKKGLYKDQRYDLSRLPKETREYILRFHGLKKELSSNVKQNKLNYFPNKPFVTQIKVDQIYSYFEQQQIDGASYSVLKHINGFDYKNINSTDAAILVPTKIFGDYFSLNKINTRGGSSANRNCKGGGVHTAKYGDNFVNLSKKYHLKVDYLKDINPGIIAIRPGLKIKLC